MSLKSEQKSQFSTERVQINNTDQLVLTEESFIELFLNRRLTEREMKPLGISHRLYATTRAYYKPKYKESLSKVRSSNHAKALTGNTHGARPPKVDIGRDILNSYLLRGYLPVHIAKDLGVSEFLVRRNLRKYKLEPSKKLPPGVFDLEDPTFLEICGLSPSLKEAADHYMENPLAYYQAVYIAFVKLHTLLWYTESIGKSLSWWRATNKIDRNHICWSANKPEMLLAEALLARGVVFSRCYRFVLDEKIWWADFYLESRNLVIEVDGSIHGAESVAENDIKKAAAYKKAGMEALFIPAVEVTENPDEVAECIVQQVYPASWKLGPERFGTSKSKKIIPSLRGG